jgi:uncharacterized protein (DUF2147 family)
MFRVAILAILGVIRHEAEGGRRSGQIYNPADGKAHKADMTEEGADELKAQDRALGRLACKGQIWRRIG